MSIFDLFSGGGNPFENLIAKAGANLQNNLAGSAFGKAAGMSRPAGSSGSLSEDQTRGLVDELFGSGRGQYGPGPGPGTVRDPVATDLPNEARAFLNATSYGEAPDYNTSYGGTKFSDTSKHPRQRRVIDKGPYAGRTSDAAGRYQILGSTYDSLGGGDFSAASQDKLAWTLAQRDYKTRTGRDLLGDLQTSGMTPNIVRSLGPTWEAFTKGSPDTFINVYNDSMNRYRGTKGPRDFSVTSPPNPTSGIVTSNIRGYNPDIARLRPELRSGIEKLQSDFGRDLPVVSGYRNRDRNARAGGARNSQHLHGNAVDIDVSDMSPAERTRLIETASANGFTGIGVYANSVHLDYGPRRAWGPDHRRGSVPGWAEGSIGKHLGRTGNSRAVGTGGSGGPSQAGGQSILPEPDMVLDAIQKLRRGEVPDVPANDVFGFFGKLGASRRASQGQTETAKLPGRARSRNAETEQDYEETKQLTSRRVS